MFENWQKLVSSNKIDLVHERITYYITEQDQQKPTQPISTPKENDAEKPELTPSLSRAKDVDKDMELNMSDGISKIEQQLQHIASESEVDQSEEQCIVLKLVLELVKAPERESDKKQNQN